MIQWKGRIQHTLVGMLKELQKKTKKMSIEEQLNFIDSFPPPASDFERVFFQYKAIFCDSNKFYVILLNIISWFLIPFSVLYFLWNRIVFKSIDEKCKAVVIWYPNKYGSDYDYSDIIPKEDLEKEFRDVKNYKAESYFERYKGVFGRKAFSVWFTLFCQYPLYGYMNLICLSQVMWINKIIMMYNPMIILEGRRETAFTSTIVTSFCESIGKEYAIFMHGDIYIDKNMSFVKISRFYVWDYHYQKIFQRVYALAKVYCNYVPASFLNNNNKTIGSYYTYYLEGNEPNAFTENVLEIKRLLIILSSYGKKIKVRPHPRWSDIEQINKLFMGTGIEVEDVRKVTIEESLSASSFAMSTISTVLLQAHFKGIPIIIDDVSHPTLFKELRNSMFLPLYKPHRLLSDIILEEK